MLTKKLIFMLGLLVFILSNIGLYVFKVDELSFKVSQNSIQALMDSTFYVKGISTTTGVTYEILDPHVSVLDTGDISFALDLTLTAKPEVEWGKVAFISTPMYHENDHSIDLQIPGKVQLIVLDKNSDDANFNLWNKDIHKLVADVTFDINRHLSKHIIYALSGGELRLQADFYSLKNVTKTRDGLDIVLNVHQGLNIFILYMVMVLSVITFVCGYLFVGGTAGWKDPDDKGFRDPKKLAERRRAGDRKRKKEFKNTD